MRKNILLIHTGGTIGMVRTEQGYAPQAGYIAKVLNTLKELENPEMPCVELYEMNPLLDSTNIALKEWNQIASIISDHYQEYDGFVVLHGTDTMAYTASALAFMLENLGKPVVLTGSQIPFCEVRNDARDNLLTALCIAQRSDLFEVCLYFGGKLLRGVRSTKQSADALKAFNSPNEAPLAVCGIDIRMDPKMVRPAPKAPFRFLPFVENQIAVLKVFPGIQFSIYENILREDLKGIILEGFGSGNIPDHEANGLIPVLEHAKKYGIAVVIVTQCERGAARPELYAVNSKLVEHGIISGYDMTLEAAVTKLYALLSSNLSQKELKIWMETSICGELTE